MKCFRCEDWMRLGLSDTCPSCVLAKEYKISKVIGTPKVILKIDGTDIEIEPMTMTTKIAFSDIEPGEHTRTHEVTGTMTMTFASYRFLRDIGHSHWYCIKYKVREFLKGLFK